MLGPHLNVYYYGMSNDSKVIVYSADWCAFCHAAKDYLKKSGVEFEERDVEHHREYAEEAVKKSGQMGIPVLDIGGTIIIGFDRPKINAALRDKQLI